MPTYIMLSTLTPEGVQTVKNNPQRIREVNSEVEQLGATVKAQWADARALRLRQRRRGARRADDGARLARARLARHRPVRDAAGDPDRRLHRLALSRAAPKVLVVGARRARARDRPRARALAAGARAAVRARQPGHRGRRAAARRRGRRRRRARRDAARAEGVDLVVVGPEAPLVAGARRRARGRRHRAVRAERGGRAAGGLEGVRQGGHGGGRRADRGLRASSTTVEAGMAAIDGYPVVVKSDGLAAGKGVVIARRRGAGARRAGGRSSSSAASARRSVVVEECLDGEELSLLALCDGERALPMAPAQDYKRIFDGDEGPNTGGMGSYSPVPGLDAERARECRALVHQPVVDVLRAPRHAVPRRPLRRPDAHRRRRAGARVQRALRRPRDAGGAAAAALGPLELLRARGEPGRPRRRRAGVGRRLGGDARARQRRLPGDAPRRATSSAASTTVAARRRGHARGHRAARRRRDRDRRRARPERHRARRRRPRPPATPPMLPRTGSTSKAASCAATSPCARWTRTEAA